MKPKRPRLRRLLRVGFFVFLAVVAVLLVQAARAIDWAEVVRTVEAYDARTLLLAGALTVASYTVYTGYDIAARSYAHHALPRRRVALIGLVSYAFALNIGALVGGTGFRFRLYSQSGLGVAAISRVAIFSITTNWAGYLLAAGVLFASRAVSVPPRWEIGTAGLQALGVAMLLTVAAYLAACHFTHGRMLHVRGHHFRLPSVPLALAQLALATTNWSLMAAIVHVLLPEGIGYPTVFGTLLLAAVAGAIAHIPAGIGVLEATFVAMLGHIVPAHQLLGALLAYRTFYYLGPLLVALALYLVFEARIRRARPA